MISDPQQNGRKHRVMGIILAAIFITYVGSYAILRMTKVFVRKEWGYDRREKPVWYSHEIETAGAVKDRSKRNVALWIAFWPVHSLESAVRNVLQPNDVGFP